MTVNRANAVVRRLLLWCFRNRETGAITVAQTPNLALSVFLVATAILWLTHPTGAISAMAKVVATGSLIVWALDEVVRGVNPWRRFLGVDVLLIAESFLLRGYTA
jgi:predicted neutral ceramidase superfamily lipid hydrolase